MENSVLNGSDPKYRRQAPGLYMIHCLQNDYRYYGQTSNISGRLASHKSHLRRKIHPNKRLQDDWNSFSYKNFSFVVLYIGSEWKLKKDRLQQEALLIDKDSERCYNLFSSENERKGLLNPFFKKRHSEKTKEIMSQSRKGVPNDNLGRKISIKEKLYSSIAEASRQLGTARKTVRSRVNSPKFPDWKEMFENEDIFEK